MNLSPVPASRQSAAFISGGGVAASRQSAEFLARGLLRRSHETPLQAGLYNLGRWVKPISVKPIICNSLSVLLMTISCGLAVDVASLKPPLPRELETSIQRG